jgi:high-affinity nickel-transport protein
MFQDKLRSKRRAAGEDVPDLDHDPRHSHMLMMRILGPLITFVNRPWKVRTIVSFLGAHDGDSV